MQDLDEDSLIQWDLEQWEWQDDYFETKALRAYAVGFLSKSQ
jgi:hypothetical protein